MGAPRPTQLNWPNLVQRVIDDYLSHDTTLAHAVQKDAIQNSWDARTNRRRGSGWGCRLELLTDSDGQTFLVIADTGTTGLTGRVLQPEEYEAYLPDEERWARFESLAFTHPDPTSDNLGARGQGKFILVGASKARRIFYDSQRTGGSYRAGARWVTANDSPVVALDDGDGRAAVAKLSPDIPPLAEVGTRVIIVNPVDEVSEAFRSGEIVADIAATWWPIIQKYGAVIQVAVRSPGFEREETVTVPALLSELPRGDSPTTKAWVKENHRLQSGGERFNVKRLHVIHDSSNTPVPRDLCGVAMIRGGMVITQFQAPHLPESISARIVGYVEFDEELDRAMKAAESPTHYSFNTRSGVGYSVKQWLSSELNAFASAKLGLGGDRRENTDRQQRDAERRALQRINAVARRLGLVGQRGPGGGGGGGGGGGAGRHPIAAELDAPVLPRPEARRIEFGESLGNIRVRAVNNTDAPAECRVKLYVTRGDAEMATYISGWDVSVGPRSRTEWSGVHTFTADPGQHLPGSYVIRAKLTVVSSRQLPKMHEHKDAYQFWLAEDPPLGGIFEDVDGLEYLDESVKIDSEAVPSREGGGWRFQYNLEHPMYRRVADDPQRLMDYLFSMMAREMLFIDLRTEHPKLFTAEQLEDRAEHHRRSSQILSEILYDYYEG
jgi:hypothetical protein